MLTAREVAVSGAVGQLFVHVGGRVVEAQSGNRRCRAREVTTWSSDPESGFWKAAAGPTRGKIGGGFSGWPPLEGRPPGWQVGPRHDKSVDPVYLWTVGMQGLEMQWLWFTRRHGAEVLYCSICVQPDWHR